LNAEPFSAHPNTGTFFISKTHNEAWHYLLLGIESQEPFLLLTGEYGMGKTLLCLRLLKFLQEKGAHRVEYITGSNEGYKGILRRIVIHLGMSPLSENEKILQDMIYARFSAESENARFYLIIDDAQELDTTTLTKLKHLSDFNYNEFFPIIIIFVGHPSFLMDLTSSMVRSINRRIKSRYHLTQFSLEDTKNYIFFRLLKSGAAGVPTFPDETIKKIFEFSRGIPRLIHNICETCLLIAALKRLISVPPDVVDEAKKIVEASLTTEEAEKGIGADSTTDERVPNNILNELPIEGAAPPVIADEAKQMVESSLTKTEVENGTEAGPNTDVRAHINISRELLIDGAADYGSMFSPQKDKEEKASKTILPQVSFFDQGVRKIVTITVIVILQLLSVVVLLKFFMNNDKMFTFFLRPP
jgi:type II secretory pathway predicted ATPase ExeA